MSLTSPVLICGAGISGLALAQGLLKASIPFRIFERDYALNIRSQGYRVRINGVGIAALNQLLPPDLFNRLHGSCASITTKGAAPHTHLDAFTGGKIDWKSPLEKGRNIHGEDEPLNADRTVLRSVLIRGLESFIEFGKEFEKFKTTPEGIIVKFGDGTEVTGSILVGADGAKSKARKQLLPGHQFIDTEGRWFYGKTNLTPELERTFNGVALEGLTLVQDQTKEIPLSLLLEPVRFKDNEFRGDLPADYLYWVLGARKDFFAADDTELLGLSPEESAAMTRKLTSNWDTSFHALFNLQNASQTSILRIDSSTPNIPALDSTLPVTMIGDAIHAMSPTAGVGAVTALRDAATLAKLFEEGGVNIQSLRKYEDSMRHYAGEAIRNSARGGKFLFGMKSFEELTAARI
jgi:2-polyprenyl-6-methoxyphenol hydroxylase-like FAD-dependent oxidoreductase